MSLAGIADLRTYALGEGRCNASVRPLLGGERAPVAERYAQASPLELAPLRVPLRIVHGARDAIVPLAQSEALASAERMRGGDVVLDVLPRAGHFDLIAPFADAWRTVERRVLSLPVSAATEAPARTRAPLLLYSPRDDLPALLGRHVDARAHRLVAFGLVREMVP